VTLGLFRLGLGRVLPRAAWLGLVVLFVLAAARDWTPEHALLAEDSGPGAGRRQAVWALFGLVVLPVLVARAAGVARSWREGDCDWFAPLPIPREHYAWTACTGLWLGGLLAALLAGGTAELFASEGGDTYRWQRTLANPTFLLLEGDRGRGWTQTDLVLDELPPGARVVFEPTVAAGSGPAMTVRVTLADAGGKEARREARVFGPTSIALDVPGGARGAARLRVERIGAGAVLALPRASLEVHVPTASDRLASLELWLRALLTLLAWTGFAAGLGAWIRPSLSAGVTLALLSIPHWSRFTLPWLPGADAVHAWDLVGAGLVPGTLEARGAVACLALGLGGAAALGLGLGRGRGAA